MARRKVTELPIDPDAFEKWFSLDGAGRAIALDALKMGRISTAVEAIEIVCVVNEFYSEIMFRTLLEELAPHGKSSEYFDAVEAGDDEWSARVIVGTLGEERTKEVMVGIMRRVREEVGIPELVADQARVPWYLRMRPN
jgi:hypothetical protein